VDPRGADLLANFACLPIGPATAGGACAAFMRTRCSWSTASTTAELKRRLVSRVASLRTRPLGAVPALLP
jgi:hypothetical protein